MARRAGVVAGRHPLHGRILQSGGETDLRAGRALSDPKKLFNASLDGNVRRAIDIREGDKLDITAFKKLIVAAAKANAAALAQRIAKKKK